MVAFNPTLETFSISHAQVLDGTKSFLDALAAVTDALDIYGVNSGSLEPDLGSYDNQGDDVIRSNWGWLNKAKLAVQAGYMPFPLIGNLTGRTVDSSTFGGKEMFGIDLWHEDSMNVAPKPMLLKCPAKDKNGTAADLIIGLYRVQFDPITFDGPKYKDGLKINYGGSALYSALDEKGVAFPDGKQRVGRLLAIAR